MPLLSLVADEDAPYFKLIADYSYWFWEFQETGEGDDDDFEDEYEKEQAARPEYPCGTVVFYGPDDKITTKIAAGVFLEQGAEPIIER
jgi:hypothetical protein